MESFKIQLHSFLPEVYTGEFRIYLPAQFCLAADTYRKALDLSAGFIVWRQTYTGKPCICLPGLLSSGRHIQEILRFVCLVYCLAADIYRKFLDLSAGFIA